MRKKSDEQSDVLKSPVGRELESQFSGGDFVIGGVRRRRLVYRYATTETD